MIKDDVESGKLPLLLVANAGKCCGQTITKKACYYIYIKSKIKRYFVKQLSDCIDCISRNIRKYLYDHTIIICPEGVLTDLKLNCTATVLLIYVS